MYHGERRAIICCHMKNYSLYGFFELLNKKKSCRLPNSTRKCITKSFLGLNSLLPLTDIAVFLQYIAVSLGKRFTHNIRILNDFVHGGDHTNAFLQRVARGE